MSTLVFVDPKSSTQAEGAQSFREPIDTETPESPLTVVPPTSLHESTSPTLVPIILKTACMVVRVPPAMSSGHFASMAEVAAMSEFVFRKRFRSSYEGSPSLSPPNLPLQNYYQGTSELVEDSEEDDDEEIEESLDSDSVSEDAEDEGPTAEDEDLATGDEDVEVHTVESGRLGLEEEEEDVPGGQQQAASVVRTAVSVPLRLGYRAFRRRELALEEDHVYSTFEVGQGYGFEPKSKRPERVSASRQPTLTTWTDPDDGMVYIDVPAYPPPVQTPPSPEWTSGSLFISPSPSVVPLPVSSPMIPLSVPSPIATPTTTETEGFLTELGAQVKMQGGLICDHAVRLEELSPALFERYDRDIGELITRSRAVRDEIFSQRYRFKSLEHEQERTAMTFGALWRPVLALEACAVRVDTLMIDMSRVGYDDHKLVHDMLLQQTALQRELQEMRGRVTALEQETDRRERGQFYPCVSALRLVARDIADTYFLTRIWRMM
nr:hypothetical protein [Tanacetum cinerariifolium]